MVAPAVIGGTVDVGVENHGNKVRGTCNERLGRELQGFGAERRLRAALRERFAGAGREFSEPTSDPSEPPPAIVLRVAVLRIGVRGDTCVPGINPFKQADRYRADVLALRARLPGLAHVLIVPDETSEGLPDGCIDLTAALGAASRTYEIPQTDPEDPALLHFTSGTTGKPKGALHVHRAVVAHHATGRLALDLHDGDLFWCTADPGWVTGTSYGIIAPLTNGVASIVDEADFDADRWYQTIAKHKVSVWYSAPTAIRMLMKDGTQAVRRHDVSTLRHLSSRVS